MARYDVAVVGLGLFGSAALRRLAERGASAVGIGPAEPESWESHDGVFSSHYDSGRITRRIDRNYAWADLAMRSIEAYGPLESLTGIEFHHPVGTLWVDADRGRIREIASVAEALDVTCELGETSAGEPVRGFRWPDGLGYAFEAAPAGYIDPRRLIDAQLSAATDRGAVLVRDVAVDRHRGGTTHRVRTANGEIVEAERVVVAAGAYANAHGLLDETLPLRIKTEVTILAPVAPGLAEAYSELPTLIYGTTHPALSDFYLVPPTVYPDGRAYLKAGADTAGDLTLSTPDELGSWMRAGDSERHHDDFRSLLRELLPELPLDGSSMKRCLITYTAHGLPYIDELDAGLFVVTGGNGRGAKSSDAIGAAAAELALGAWSDPLPRDHFCVPRDARSMPEAVPL